MNTKYGMVAIVNIVCFTFFKIFNVRFTQNFPSRKINLNKTIPIKPL